MVKYNIDVDYIELPWFGISRAHPSSSNTAESLSYTLWLVNLVHTFPYVTWFMHSPRVGKFPVGPPAWVSNNVVVTSKLLTICDRIQKYFLKEFSRFDV